ncbi:MAG: nuclear transport factor 2 family protein [Candidatus Acidiferrales bacterium]
MSLRVASRDSGRQPTTQPLRVDAERQWAEAACNHNRIAEKILAEDFQGTSPEGKRYRKSEEVAELADASKTAQDCRLLDANVRFFGDELAMVYGTESSLRIAKDGTAKTRCLIWTDTWLKRKGNWQIIAAQDTQFGCK